MTAGGDPLVCDHKATIDVKNASHELDPSGRQLSSSSERC